MLLLKQLVPTLAESTTAVARHVIEFPKDLLEEKYPGAKAVYGDTDSAFLRLPESMRKYNDEEIFRVGIEMAALVTAAYEERLAPEKSYIVLEFEKFLRPLCLLRKKRYMGLSYEAPDKNKLLAKGIEVVRKDAAPVLRQAQEDLGATAPPQRCAWRGKDCSRVPASCFRHATWRTL